MLTVLSEDWFPFLSLDFFQSLFYFMFGLDKKENQQLKELWVRSAITN